MADLPPEFGPWQTVWKRHHRYSADGTWDLVLAELLADAAGELDWVVSIDSSVIRAHQHAATARRSVASAGRGRPLVISVTAGQAGTRRCSRTCWNS